MLPPEPPVPWSLMGCPWTVFGAAEFLPAAADHFLALWDPLLWLEADGSREVQKDLVEVSSDVDLAEALPSWPSRGFPHAPITEVLCLAAWEADLGNGKV